MPGNSGETSGLEQKLWKSQAGIWRHRSKRSKTATSYEPLAHNVAREEKLAGDAGGQQGSCSQRGGLRTDQKGKDNQENVVSESGGKSGERCTVSDVAKSSWQAKTASGSLPSANKELAGDLDRAVVECWVYVVVYGTVERLTNGV